MSLSMLNRLLAATTLAASALFVSASQAAPTHIALNPPLPSDTPHKIEILGFFSYSCSHCATMEPLVAKWAKSLPADVVLKQVPIAFNAGMKPLQQLYFTLQALNRPDLHPKVFHALFNENQRLFDKKNMGDWIVKQGVELDKFNAVFDSFSVQTQVQRANQLTQAYNVDGMPMFAVGGKYVTSPAMAGNSYEGALTEIDKLIPMVRAQ